MCFQIPIFFSVIGHNSVQLDRHTVTRETILGAVLDNCGSPSPIPDQNLTGGRLAWRLVTMYLTAHGNGASTS